MANFEECKAFAKIINLRDEISSIKDIVGASEEAKKLVIDLNNLITKNFENFFGTESEYSMRYTKSHKRIVIVKPKEEMARKKQMENY